jgi:hypothetical protein
MLGIIRIAVLPDMSPTVGRALSMEVKLHLFYSDPQKLELDAGTDGNE